LNKIKSNKLKMDENLDNVVLFGPVGLSTDVEGAADNAVGESPLILKLVY
jgi:hypothetical protein